MAKKGLDTTFLHYGIRKEDMSMIEKASILTFTLMLSIR